MGKIDGMRAVLGLFLVSPVVPMYTVPVCTVPRPLRCPPSPASSPPIVIALGAGTGRLRRADQSDDPSEGTAECADRREVPGVVLCIRIGIWVSIYGRDGGGGWRERWFRLGPGGKICECVALITNVGRPYNECT